MIELESLLVKHRLPGMTFAYVLQDGTIGEIACGFADLETKEPMTPRSRMLAASVGKTFVAATLLSLAVQLDKPLSYWLGDRRWYSRLANHQTITLRHLLMHSSGLPSHVYTPIFQQSLCHASFSPESLIECILDQPPLFKAGKGWAYTDTGYILLGLVIEKVSGKSYYEELKERFLQPLKLEMTSPSDQKILPGLAAGYAAPNPFGLPEKTIDESGLLLWNPAIEWTGGGLVSTSRDLAIWAKTLYEGRAMKTEYLPDLLQSVSIGDGIQYGAGVVINPTGPVWGHHGSIPGYSSSVRYYPKKKAAIAFQINTDRGISDCLSEIERCLMAIVQMS